MEYDVSRCKDDREYGKTSFVNYGRNLRKKPQVNYFANADCETIQLLHGAATVGYSMRSDRQATACF